VTPIVKCCDSVLLTWLHSEMSWLSLTDMLSVGTSWLHSEISRLYAVSHLCWRRCGHCICALWTCHLLLQLCTTTWCLSVMQVGHHSTSQDLPALSTSTCCKSALTAVVSLQMTYLSRDVVTWSVVGMSMSCANLCRSLFLSHFWVVK